MTQARGHQINLPSQKLSLPEITENRNGLDGAMGHSLGAFAGTLSRGMHGVSFAMSCSFRLLDGF